MYVKPELRRYGTFRDVTRNTFNWCWMYPDFPLCSPASTQEGGQGSGTGEEDRS